jgi:hypothetical protein
MLNDGTYESLVSWQIVQYDLVEPIQLQQRIRDKGETRTSGDD